MSNELLNAITIASKQDKSELLMGLAEELGYVLVPQDHFSPVPSLLPDDPDSITKVQTRGQKDSSLLSMDDFILAVEKRLSTKK